MSHPIITIVKNDGTEYPAGVKYAQGYDGARGEAREVYGLEDGEYTLRTDGWTSSTSGLSGCRTFTFG